MRANETPDFPIAGYGCFRSKNRTQPAQLEPTMQETSKIQRQVTVTCENGLHLNPISQLVRRAVSFGSTISLSFDGRRADVKSAFDLMLLAAPAGAVMDLEVTGPDAEQASESIIRLFESGFPGPGLPSH